MKRAVLFLFLVSCSAGEDLDPEGSGGDVAAASGGASSDGGTVGTGGEDASSGGAETGSGGETEEWPDEEGSGGSSSTGGASFDDQPRCDWIDECKKLPGTCTISVGVAYCEKTGGMIAQYGCGAGDNVFGVAAGGFFVGDADLEGMFSSADAVFPCEHWGEDDGGFCTNQEGLSDAQEFCSP